MLPAQVGTFQRALAGGEMDIPLSLTLRTVDRKMIRTKMQRNTMDMDKLLLLDLHEF